ncbi:MAG: VanW family protein [Clostridia bacterium]|nr:VanW family protein [Clostridia bacterium]
MPKKHAKILFSILAALSVWALSAAAVTLPQPDFTLTVTAGKNRYVFTYPEIDFGADGLPYLKNTEAAAERIYYDTLIPPKDAAVAFTPLSKRKFSFTKEQNGRAVNVADLAEKINSAVKKGTCEIEADFVTLVPQVTKKKLEACTFKRADFSTNYENSAENRKRNVELAVKTINGTIVGDGEIFSFNDTVGERNEERGYTRAKVIYEGKFTDGIGGGVCQVSSTLFNCALLSGLDVIERHAHSLAVSYVEPSFDAAVYYGGYDLKFLNGTGGPVFIECYADGINIVFNIYGMKKNFSVKRISRVIDESEAGYDVIEDETGELCGEEDEKTIIPGKKRIKSSAELEYLQNGIIIKKLKLGTDAYAGQKGVLARKKYVQNVIKTP